MMEMLILLNNDSIQQPEEKYRRFWSTDRLTIFCTFNEVKKEA
jgi:hypothetical protein